MNYRREIDGLRAFAVVVVILYHAGFEAFGGGFVGVDVFFVISGYLIATIIFSELKFNEFSIVKFYERRARRIIPALFLVMLVCLPFSWIWMLPNDMKEFSQSLVAVTLFGSNILFWQQSGYFDTAAELKPLLHTWSLAVEEQYYLFLPILLIMTWRFGGRCILIILSLIFLISIILTQWGSNIDPMAAFYLLPTRAWEFLIGVFAALYLASKKPFQPSKFISEAAGLLGLSLLFYSIFSFNKATPFPSIYTLMPTIGAAIIIVFSSSKTFVGKILGINIFVNVGLISYSAYLWHQPLFAFVNRRGVFEPGQLFFVVLILLTFVLAFLSWRYVEIPFRNNKLVNGRNFIIFVFIGSVLFVVFGILGHISNGFENRLSEQERKLLSFNSYEYKKIYKEGSCFLMPEQDYSVYLKACSTVENNGENIMIWGDSHAAALSFGFYGVFSDVVQYTASGCPPILDLDIVWRPMCREINNYVSLQIDKIKPKHIFLHADWMLYRDQQIQINLQKTIDFIHAKSPFSQITIVGGVPQYKPSLPTLMYYKKQSLNDDVYENSYSHRNLMQIEKMLMNFAKHNNVDFYSAYDAFCDGNSCLVTAKYKGEVMPVAWDYGHLTEAGAIFLASKIKFQKSK